jgi:putative hydrolase of the HAD superfamily
VGQHATSSTRAPQTLLIDADDTLWENNVYFERAIAEFITFLNHETHTREEVRAILNEVEHENILHHGYGSQSFAHALVGTFERLSKEPLTPALRETIHGFAHAVAEHPVEIIAEVPETLAYLRERHHLILVTKGNFTEQTGKIERSGLKDYFAAVEIVAEKKPPTYREITAKYALDPESTWMTGNSPRSDINPALAAGLNAIFVPHADTWVLEHEEVCTNGARGTLLVVEQFGDLREHF